MTKEKISFIASTPNDEEIEVNLVHEDNVITLEIDGEVFSCDWEGNFQDVVKRALELWT